MRYSSSVESYHGVIRVLLCAMIAMIGFLLFFWCSYNPEIKRYEGEEYQKANVDSEHFVSAKSYERLMRDGNLVAGAEEISTRFWVDRALECDEGGFITFRQDVFTNNEISRGATPAIVVDNKYSIVILEDDVVYKYLFAKDEFYLGNNPVNEYVQGNEYDYIKIAKVLQKQHSSEISVSDVSMLISLTLDNVLISFDGENAVFAKKSVENDINYVEFIVVDKNSEKTVTDKYTFNPETKVMCSNNCCFFADKEKFYVLPLDKPDDMYYVSADSGESIIAINYAEDLNSSNVYFSTGTKIYYFNDYDEKSDHKLQYTNGSSGNIYINHSNWFDGPFSEKTYVITINVQEDNGVYSNCFYTIKEARE